LFNRKLINYTINTFQKNRLIGIISIVAILIIPFLIYYKDSGSLESEQSFCPFKMLTGFPCPGCGITKSIVYFYDGNLLKSFTHHLFGPFVVILSVFFIVKFAIELKTKKVYLNFSYTKRKKIAYSIASILVVYHIIRIMCFIKNNSLDTILRESIWQ
jgi:uncharacterized membrane protein